MSNKNYKLPKTRKEKAALLKSLVKGETLLDDLKEDEFTFVLWKDDPTDPGYKVTFDGAQRMSQVEFENYKLTNKGIFFSFDLTK